MLRVGSDRKCEDVLESGQPQSITDRAAPGEDLNRASPLTHTAQAPNERGDCLVRQCLAVKDDAKARALAALCEALLDR